MFYCDGFSLNHVVMKLQLRYNESCDIKLNNVIEVRIMDIMLDIVGCLDADV